MKKSFLIITITVDDMLSLDEDSMTIARINGTTSSSENGYLSFGESVVSKHLSYIDL